MINRGSGNNKLEEVWSTFVDCVILNFLWFVFSLPIVTIGASTAATYYTANKVIRNGDGKLFVQFKKSFIENFKQATVIWLITIVIEGIQIANIYICKLQYMNGITDKKYYWLFMMMAAFFAIWFISASAYLTKFDNPLRLIIKNSILIFTKNFKDTIVIVCIILVGIAAVWIYVRLIIVVPAFVLYFISGNMNNIYEMCIAENGV